MKLIIKTKDIEIEYQDEYSMLELEAKERIESLIKTICSSQSISILSIPKVGTVDEIFNNKK